MFALSSPFRHKGIIIYNKIFPSYLVSLSQNESLCETFLMKKKFDLDENELAGKLIFILVLTCFDTEV